MTQTIEIITERIDPSDYLYLAAKVAYKFRSKNKFERIVDTEVYSIACEELIKAVNTYKSDRGDFSRFAWRSMTNGILQRLRAQKRLKRSASFDEIDPDKWKNLERKDQGNAFEKILPLILKDYDGETLQERKDKQLVIDHYINGKRINLLAEANCITRQSVHNRINRCLARLKDRALILLGD